MAKGQVAEMGNHKELVAAGRVFQKQLRMLPLHTGQVEYMLTCGANKPGERMSKLKIKVEDCVDEGEVGEVEVGSEEEVLEKEEVLTTG